LDESYPAELKRQERLAIDWPVIVREQGPLVWRTAMRLLLNEADVSDCFQETFVSALEFAGRHRVANWAGLLQRIATARALDQLRRRMRERSRIMQPVTEDVPWHGADPAQEAEAIELSDRLVAALATLPPTQSQAFCLRYLSGLDYAEIAKAMGISVSSAGGLIHRARAALEESLLGATTTDSQRTLRQP
jgi:RNA polymerase sigma-70 factor (ECF subfamily)